MLSSCRTIRYVPLPEQHSRDSVQMITTTKTKTTTIDRTHTLIQRGDTVFKTDSIYVEKLTDLEVHDTITVTIRDSIPYPVEVPIEVEKPVPWAYRYSLWFTILLIIFLIFYIAIRFYLHR